MELIFKKTDDVYGVSNQQIESYIERNHVDDKFVEGLKSQRHIIVYGASKQGKTALINKHLKTDDFVRVDCAPNSTPLDLYKSVLRQLNVEFNEERSLENFKEINPNTGIKAKVKIPFFGEAEANAGISGKSYEKEVLKFTSVEFNLGLAQDIAEILKSFNSKARIILENFHYLDEDVQKQLAFDLRIFEDHNILFIVLGIWREKNRLSQYNGDLLDRMLEVPVEPWSTEDFIRVLREGEPLLNVSFSEIDQLIVDASFGSIGVFQELCNNSCKLRGVTETNQNDTIEITPEDLQQAIRLKLEDYAGRHVRALETLIEQRAKSSDEVPLYIAHYFVNAILKNKFDDIRKGFHRKDIHEMIKREHHRPEDVRASDLSYFLHNIVASQIKKSIIPPIFDYDRNTRMLIIIDSTFYFFLENANKDDILEDLGNPEI